ncbi:response regulator [Desertivirga arenae]|uniref:response regulator n=1 Tax=Desertivirga arenae TaxID=2810309 RepID=UPI001A977D99|nr:response regulator [Pedobacter sp. SYSU D00823]
MKILIAEDDAVTLKVLETRLKRAGHEVESSIDGIEALEKIAAYQPDLVITDILMPYSSGLEFAGVVKQNYDIPIIILSGLHQEKVIVEAFALGIDDYITKPFSALELISRVNRLVLK